MHFYQLSALDWVDVLQIPKADPGSCVQAGREPVALDRQLAQRAESRAGQGEGRRRQRPARHLRQRLLGTSGDASCSPEVNLLAFSHYLQALEYQRKAKQVVGMLGAKTPHIQNLAVGGVANAINLDSQAALEHGPPGDDSKSLLDEVNQFVQQVYFVDVCAIAAMYPEWFKYGGGVHNYLAVPDLPLDSRGHGVTTCPAATS